MSITYDLVCDELKLEVWIGQGYDFKCFYSGDKEVMESLHEFLWYTKGKPVRLISEFADEEVRANYSTIQQFKIDHPEVEWRYPYE